MEEKERTITVTGKGWVNMTPDITRVTIDNTMILDSYSEAFEASRQNNKKFQECMKACGLEPSKLRTTKFDIDKYFEREYDEHHNWKDVFVGYRLQQTLRIELGMNNALLTNLVKAIGNAIKEDIEIEIGYSVRDSRPAELRMLEKAVNDATEKAQLMAKAGLCVLEGVKSIDFSEQPVSVYFHSRNIRNSEEAGASSSESLDITPSDLGAGKDVTVAWYLRPMNAEELEQLAKEKEVKHYDLDRFLKAQEKDYEGALKEMQNGKKLTHWIWYIFPQLKGFGSSKNSEFYGLEDGKEAMAYINHPVLGKRLRQITMTLLANSAKIQPIPIKHIMNRIDVMKVRSCMTLFWEVSHELIFKQVLDTMLDGKEDLETVKKLHNK